MSSFTCEICGTAIIDSPEGYQTECEHFKLEKYKLNKKISDLVPEELQNLDSEK